MARAESLRIGSSGASLSVRHYAGDGIPIVLLHGGPGMGDYFGAMAEMLSPPHRVISYDQRGCGKSVCDGSFDVDKQIADVDAVRAHFGAERVIAKPKRSPVAWVLAGTLMQMPGKLGDLGFGFIMQQLLPNYVVRPDVTRVPFDVNRGSKRAWRRTNASIKMLADDHLSGIAFDAPVLIVYGEHDVIRETSPMLGERYRGATTVRIANAAHFPWLEQPEVFAKTLSDFYHR